MRPSTLNVSSQVDPHVWLPHQRSLFQEEVVSKRLPPLILAVLSLGCFTAISTKMIREKYPAVPDGNVFGLRVGCDRFGVQHKPTH